MFKSGVLIESVKQVRILEFLEKNFNPEKFEIDSLGRDSVSLKDEEDNKVTIQYECGKFTFDYKIDEIPF